MKKIIILIMLISTIMLIFSIVGTDYNFDNVNYHSYSIADNLGMINYSENISDFSFSPLEEFCSDKNMQSYYGKTTSDTGCIDEFGNRYHYNVSYRDDFWTIGNKTYKAIWNQQKSI